MASEDAGETPAVRGSLALDVGVVELELLSWAFGLIGLAGEIDGLDCGVGEQVGFCRGGVRCVVVGDRLAEGVDLPCGDLCRRRVGGSVIEDFAIAVAKGAGTMGDRERSIGSVERDPLAGRTRLARECHGGGGVVSKS